MSKRSFPQDPSDPFEQSEQLERAERVAYLYLSPVIVALGMAGCVANLVVLGGGGKRFEGRFFVYLRVRRNTRIDAKLY